MGIELPGELADVAARAGVRWPQADEDGMRRAAAAWREAGERIDALARDSDGSARHALDAVHGGTGDAARRHWDGFVGPDGHLPTAARGCHAAADRLEHAADQVGAAKVQIVRHLVTLAKNRDAAHQAAAAGHPTALAGLDVAVRGTAANVAHVHQALTQAVRQDGGVDAGAVPPLVHASPGAGPSGGGGHGSAWPSSGGAHGAGTPVQVGAGPDGVAGRIGPGGVTVDLGAGQGHGGYGDSGGYGLGGAGRPGDGLPGPGAGTGGIGAPGVIGGMPGHQAIDPRDVDPESTGPIPLGNAAAAGYPAGGRFGPTGDAAGGAWAGTPGHAVDSAANLVHQSSAGAVEPPPAEPPAPTGAAQPVPGGPAQPGTPVAFGGAGGGVLGPAEPAPGGAVAAGPGGAPGAATGTGAPGAMRPGPVTGAGPGAGTPAGPVGRLGPGAPAGSRPATAVAPDVLVDPGSRDRTVPHRPPADRPDRPPSPTGAPPSRPGRGQDGSGGSLALFVVHMFPIGHLPVPASRPSRQLPPPAPELDYAAGLRFPPQDHPESALVDDAEAMERARHGQPPARPAPAREAGDPVVAALAEGHDPLGGEHERDWDRRFLVRAGRDGRRAEYAWPPGECYPEGGSDAGEPVVLPEGTMLDRFGTAEGRVLAPAGTPFRRRSLPPEYLAEGYHRYRVLRPLPVWRAVSAAWFGQPGGGERYRATYPVADLVALGWLADVTAADSEHVTAADGDGVTARQSEGVAAGDGDGVAGNSEAERNEGTGG
ncbi:TNT domain-containing protein [Gandjariella thermophila]|uniref:DUF4237 domain-containing protein n=1 Tax=Gandjariella thermophila TaxID=1931992 RepID=A0A4D4JBW6_9PSEU|nr:TNT domain-containing protein [Gandjariella thermophila]GDY31353.1 hypothetical protein GTS_29860 [Gandjariella thermophila]